MCYTEIDLTGAMPLASILYSSQNAVNQTVTLKLGEQKIFTCGHSFYSHSLKGRFLAIPV